MTVIVTLHSLKRNVQRNKIILSYWKLCKGFLAPTC